MPRWLFLAVIAALLFLGLTLDNAVGGVILLVLAVFLAWLAAVGWEHVSALGRVLRLAVIGALVAVAASRFL